VCRCDAEIEPGEVRDATLLDRHDTLHLDLRVAGVRDHPLSDRNAHVEDLHAALSLEPRRRYM